MTRTPRTPQTARRAAAVARILATLVLPWPAISAPDPHAGVGAGRAVELPRIEFVVASAPPAPVPEAGLVVLDIDALESVEAALDLAQFRRKRTDPRLSQVCWVRARRRADAAYTMALLARADPPPCARILVPR